MDGTQIPINVASDLYPLKYKVSENIKDKKAAINKSLSVEVNFLNIS